MKFTLCSLAAFLFLAALVAHSRGLYHVGVTPPVLRQFVAPSYPQSAAISHVGGLVKVFVIVEADGSVSFANVKVEDVAGRGLDEAASTAIRKWSFSPALKDDRPVPVQVTIPVSFDGQSLEIKVDLQHLSS